MESHEILRSAFERSNVKELSSALGISQSLAYKWAQPSDQSGAANPLERLEVIMQRTGDTKIIQWLCQSVGGFFVKSPKQQTARAAQLMPQATNEAICEMSKIISEVAEASKAGRITKIDAAKIRQAWEGAKSTMEGFVNCAEEGRFQTKENQ